MSGNGKTLWGFGGQLSSQLARGKTAKAAEDTAKDGTGDEDSQAEEAEELSEARLSEDLEAEVEKTLGPTGNTYR